MIPTKELQNLILENGEKAERLRIYNYLNKQVEKALEEKKIEKSGVLLEITHFVLHPNDETPATVDEVYGVDGPREEYPEIGGHVESKEAHD